jgi:2-polyprenyl-3-methyl-5-hydroxy-6-metoxy-1,4-benzoquinol methylase
VTERLDHCDLCGSRAIRPLHREPHVCACGDCGFLFDNPRPSAEEIAGYYSSQGKYDEWLGELEGRDLLWKRRLEKVLEYASGGRLLDMGAGIGQFLVHAKPYFEVHGTEVSGEAMRIAKERYDIHLSSGRLGDAVRFTSGSFDVITLYHVLEHVPSPSATMRTCSELLNDRGLLVVAVPNDGHPYRRHGGMLKYAVKRLLGAAGMKRYEHLPRFDEIVLDPSKQSEIHLSHFTPRTLDNLIRRTGFEVLECSLDPYYSGTGLDLLREEARFEFFRSINLLFSRNFYETILIVARKVW